MKKVGPIKFYFDVVDGMLRLGVVTTFAEFWLRQSKEPPSDIAVLIGTYDIPVSRSPYIILDVRFGLAWFKRTVSVYVADTSTLLRAGKSILTSDVA